MSLRTDDIVGPVRGALFGRLRLSRGLFARSGILRGLRLRDVGSQRRHAAAGISILGPLKALLISLGASLVSFGSSLVSLRSSRFQV
jgi:hypothetical protein